MIKIKIKMKKPTDGLFLYNQPKYDEGSEYDLPIQANWYALAVED